MALDRIRTDTTHQQGQPRLRDMPLTVREVLELVAHYPDRRTLRVAQPQLQDEDIRQALLYAAERLADGPVASDTESDLVLDPRSDVDLEQATEEVNAYLEQHGPKTPSQLEAELRLPIEVVLAAVRRLRDDRRVHFAAPSGLEPEQH